MKMEGRAVNLFYIAPLHQNYFCCNSDYCSFGWILHGKYTYLIIIHSSFFISYPDISCKRKWCPLCFKQNYSSHFKIPTEFSRGWSIIIRPKKGTKGQQLIVLSFYDKIQHQQLYNIKRARKDVIFGETMNSWLIIFPTAGMAG